MYLPKAKLVKYFSGTIEACNTCAYIPSHLAHTFGHVQINWKNWKNLN